MADLASLPRMRAQFCVFFWLDEYLSIVGTGIGNHSEMPLRPFSFHISFCCNTYLRQALLRHLHDHKLRSLINT